MQALTHWGRVTHICVSKLTIIGSYNSLSPDRKCVWKCRLRNGRYFVSASMCEAMDASLNNVLEHLVDQWIHVSLIISKAAKSNFNPSMDNNDRPSKVLGEITYPIPSFNGCTVEVWRMDKLFHPTFIMHWTINIAIEVKPCKLKGS